MYELKIVTEALYELDKEIEYSIKNWGKNHARKYARDIRKQIQDLILNPYLYRLREDILPDIRIKTYKGNRFIFTIQEEQNRIVVLAVLSIHQEIDPIKLKKRERD